MLSYGICFALSRMLIFKFKIRTLTLRQFLIAAYGRFVAIDLVSQKDGNQKLSCKFMNTNQ